MSIIDFAKSELDIIGLREDSPEWADKAMRSHLLKMIEVFEEEGHSGASAQYALSMLGKLLSFKPLSPLTGEDSEWNLISEEDACYQNKRCPHVFKDRDGPYDINGRVFVREGGGSYTNSESRVWISFPYTPKIEYVKVNGPEEK